VAFNEGFLSFRGQGGYKIEARILQAHSTQIHLCLLTTQPRIRFAKTVKVLPAAPW